jgi:hypothetical protein
VTEQPDWLGKQEAQPADDRNADRGQLSLSAIEAGVGILLVFAVAATFGLGLPDPGVREAQLDRYAEDAGDVLANEPPRHGATTRLAEVAASPARFEREHDALERRVDRILPDNLLFQVETPHGTVGYPRPDGVPIGEAFVPTTGGTVHIRVWYV